MLVPNEVLHDRYIEVLYSAEIAKVLKLVENITRELNYHVILLDILRHCVERIGNTPAMKALETIWIMSLLIKFSLISVLIITGR